MKNIEEILILLKAYRFRITKKRRALIALFFQHESPLSAQDILVELKKIQIRVNKTTVYRDLERLQKINVIGPVSLGDRKKYYELASREHHHHLICLQCEHIEDVDMDEEKLFAEEKKVSYEKGFTVLRHSLEFFGLCENCKLIAR